MLPPELRRVSVPHAVLATFLLEGLLRAPSIPLRVLAGEAVDALDPDLVVAQARVKELREKAGQLREASSRVSQIGDLLRKHGAVEAEAAVQEWILEAQARKVELETVEDALADAEKIVSLAQEARRTVPGVAVSAVLDLIAALRDPHNQSLSSVLRRAVRDLRFDVEVVHVADLVTGILHVQGTLLLVDGKLVAEVRFGGEYPLPALQLLQRNVNLLVRKMRAGQVDASNPLAARLKSTVREFTLLALEHDETRRPMMVTQVRDSALMSLSYAVNYPGGRRALPDPKAGTQTRKWGSENMAHSWWRALNVEAWEATGHPAVLGMDAMLCSREGLACVAHEQAEAWLEHVKTTAAQFEVSPVLALRLAVVHLLAPQRRWRRQISSHLVQVLATASRHGGVVTPATIEPAASGIVGGGTQLLANVPGLLRGHSAVREFMHHSPGQVCVDRCSHCSSPARALLVIPEPVGAVCLGCRRDSDGIIWPEDPYDQWVVDAPLWRAAGYPILGGYLPGKVTR